MKRTKTSLLKSALALLLCVSMLVGSTFAWFTDSVTSGGNIIQSGNLELEMYWTDDLSSNVWHNVEDDAHNTIFTYENWEPGYTDVKYIKLVNKGNLALNYKLTLTPKGSVGKLAEVINVYFADSAVDVKSRADLPKLGAIGLLSNVLNGGATASGTLLAANQQSDLHPHGEIVMTLAMNMLTSAGNEYQAEDSGEFTITALATQASFEQDSFGSDYDNGAEYPAIITGDSVTQSVNAVDGKVPAGGVTMTGKGISAFVPGGAKMAAGADALTLSVTPMEHTTSDITVVNNEILTPVDVHISGLAADNTVPVVIDLGEVLPKYLNMGNYHLYHVENGANSVMTLVDDEAALTEHNRFTYDPLTGVVKVAMATFSEVALVADTTKAWEGKFDYSWYTNAVAPADSEAQTEYIIANADQLAAFSAIVGGMNDQTQDSFAGKTVKLISDINLGDSEKENNPNIIFYPIGYYNSEGTYERTNTAITSGLRNFEGTFDGNGHSISNFYQNTWEMKGDHNWYSPEEQYYRDGMGLFGRVYGGTVKNLTVNNFSSDGEITTTGCVAAYADGATFENIAIFNCNPRVYNIGNGGIVGCVGWYAKEANLKTTFKNITVDNSNKISALWGSYDVACGGIVGQYYPTSGQTSTGTPKNGGVHFENCHVSAQMDVYNDVCANYQYYAYRYTGMLIGSVRENVTIDGHSYPKMDGITAEGCTVHFGDWNDYYYCELVANSLASYTHDHQFSRLEQVQAVDGIEVTYLDGTKEIVTGTRNFVVVNGEHASENATCYHFKNGEVWNHEEGGKETINGDEVLKEDKQHIYLEFNNLVTGYGWGVTTKAVGDLAGVTILDREVADSAQKFESNITVDTLYNGKGYTIAELFKEKDNNTVDIMNGKVQVTVSPVGEESTVTGTYVANTDDWTTGTLTFSGIGKATITITDYYFCTPTTITVNITERTAVEKFETKFTGDFLYRVGNQNAVSIGSLFAAKDGAKIGNVSVTVEALNGSVVSGAYTSNATWTNGTIQFSGTGIVMVTITDNDYCTPTTLTLEVIEAWNATTATSTPYTKDKDKYDVVLLKDVSGSFTVSNGHTLYGNGFKVTLPTSYEAKSTAGFVGYITVNNGNLDNIRIEGPVYPVMNIYQSQSINKDTDKEEFFYNSILINGGNCTISNSYISGSRTAVCVRGGNNVVIENTTLSGGAVANMHVAGVNALVLRNLTTVQKDEIDSYGKGVTTHGMGIYVDSSAANITVEGTLNQYNWLSQNQWENVIGEYAPFFPKFYTDSQYSAFQHQRSGATYVNMAFIFACDWTATKLNVAGQESELTYQKKDGISITTPNGTVTGGVYSVANAGTLTDKIYNAPAYEPTGYNPVAPVFDWDNSANNDADDEANPSDSYCVYNKDNATMSIGLTGDKTLDLSGVSITKNGVPISYTAYLNGNKISGNTIAVSADAGTIQTLTFKATVNSKGYDKNGNEIAGNIEYVWNITLEVATLSYPAPEWAFTNTTRDTTGCYYVYYKTSQGYGEAVPIYDGIKVKYYDADGKLIEKDFTSITDEIKKTGEAWSLNTDLVYSFEGGTLTMRVTGSYKSGVTGLYLTAYNGKVYAYPSALDNDGNVRPSKTGYDFNVTINYTFTDSHGQSTTQTTVNWYGAKANGNSINSLQWKAFDSDNGKEAPDCLTEGTLITLADGTQKAVEDLKVGDMIMVFNHVSGKLEAMPLIFNTHADEIEAKDYDVLYLQFSNGKEAKIVQSHGFFDMTLMQYVYINYNNYQDFIGHEFYALNSNGTSGEKVELVNAFIKTEKVRIFCPVTYFHMNSFANGLLNTPNIPGDITGLVNYFEYDPDLKYNEAAMQQDIEKYGLYTYEDFSEYISEAAYNSSPSVYLKVAVGKGMITYEQIIDIIQWLLEGSLIDN